MSELFSLAVGDTEAIVTFAGVDVARYVFVDDAPAVESPKPYLHPIRTLSGAPLTGYRPCDHRWHKGLQMTLTDVSGDNFWGGPTYVDGRGYVPLDNHGRVRHDRFTAVDEAGSQLALTEELSWIARNGETWLTEERTLRFHTADTARGLWALDFATALRNVRDADLTLGSPTTNGRPAAGYTGYFLRLPRSFTGGTVTAPSGAGTAMGTEASWLAFAGQHDEVDGGGTVVAYAGRSSGAPAVKWFVRSEPIPVLAPSPTFDTEVVLAPGEELELEHRHVFGDRIWEGAELAALAAELAPARAEARR